MANQEHLDLLRQGVEVWNKWREEHPDIWPELSQAELSKANLNRVNLNRANLEKANLYEANLDWANLDRANLNYSDLRHANLNGANLKGARLQEAELEEAWLIDANLSLAFLGDAHLNMAHLWKADLRMANFIEALLWSADLSEANLSEATLWKADINRANLFKANLVNTFFGEANLTGANLREANLSGANLSGANLSEANLSGANLIGCKIYAISAWNVQLENTIQTGLIITRDDEPTITVDNLEVAQFIYLLLNNQKVREVIDTITSKVVLILGRFTPKRKAILDAIKEELRKRNYSPIVFDFKKPVNRDITETVSTLAHMARFVIADITDAKSIPQELQTIVPNLPSVPIQPLILKSQHEYSMFEHFTRFSWVLPVYRYTDEVNLLQSLQEKVITPAEQKAQELAKR